ncbi:MAG: pyrroline-5-carboxylate reductase [Spirochaetales bacterium]
MKFSEPVGIIGYGNMGRAIALGLLKTSREQVVGVLSRNESGAALAAKNKRLVVHRSLESLVAASKVVIIAVKPVDVPALLVQLRPLGSGKWFLSVAAGLSTKWLAEQLASPQVVRWMPNLAAQTGHSLVGVSPGPQADEHFATLALDLARSVGTAALIPEKLMAGITGLSGSGIAFVFQFVHALAQAGVREGFAYPKALDHALTTLEGAVSLLRAGNEHPVAWVSKVTSPAGTTIEGIKVLEAGGLTNLIMDAVSASSKRALELER